MVMPIDPAANAWERSLDTLGPSITPEFAISAVESGAIMVAGLVGVVATNVANCCAESRLACGSALLATGAVLGGKIGLGRVPRAAMAAASLALGLGAVTTKTLPQLANGSI